MNNAINNNAEKAIQQVYGNLNNNGEGFEAPEGYNNTAPVYVADAYTDQRVEAYDLGNGKIMLVADMSGPWAVITTAEEINAAI